MDYDKFLKTKVKQHKKTGFDIYDKDINVKMYPFEKFILRRALKAGKYAIFADCGLGKSFIQLEWSKHVTNKTNKPVLILAPLAVSGQTIQEGKKFGIICRKYKNGINDNGIYISNYEQLENIDCSVFSGIVLDESSILKNFTGATRNKLIETFKDTTYKLCCTATPAPNDPIELGQHAEFLDVMKYMEMLSMYFVHDSGNTQEWRLKGHAVKHFYQFVSQWAIMLNKPSDIGFDNTGYDLPPIKYIEHKIITPKKDNGELFNDTAVNATDYYRELRRTQKERLSKVADIVNNSNENYIIWIKTNDEGKELKNLIPESVEVKGSDSTEYKESKLLGFANNEFRILITKTKIAQFGMNYQNCHNQIFASLDFSFEGTYQATRRSYRFGQTSPVNIHIITTDTMANVIKSINDKQEAFRVMQDEMSDAVNKNLKHNLLGNVDYDTDDIKTDKYYIRRGDCVRLIKDIESDSIGFSIFSPPFAELYTYSSNIEDMGNSKDYEEFLIQFKYLVKELYRVVEPGRNVAIHCMDLPIQKGKEGYIGLRDFSGMILKSFEDEGFIYHSRVTIWKDPVTEMQRTKALGLLHKQIKKDSTMSRVGIPDYLMIFRKDGERNNPVKCCIDVDTWQKYASPVWFDIDQGDTLNKNSARAEEDEKHICPLQREVVKRAIILYTNPGDTVLTPFMGISTEVYTAVEMDRYGIGFELKESYYDESKKNLALLTKIKSQISLF